MITIEELKRILRMKKWSDDSKRTASTLVPVSQIPPAMLLPYTNLDFLVDIIEREIGFKVTQEAIDVLKARKQKSDG